MSLKMTFVTSSLDSGKRLDIFILNRGIFKSRAIIHKLIDSGKILVDGKASKRAFKMKAGMSVDVLPFETAAGDARIVEEDIPLDILFEDSAMVVVNKPPGMPVHPGPGHAAGTLVNALMSRLKGFKPIAGEIRPGIVHRLDMETSGVMVVAKDEGSLAELSRQFADRLTEKGYLAFVLGRFPQGRSICDRAIGRSNADRKKMSATAKRGRAAVTSFALVEDFGDLSLVEARPKTGRTHQIRVHLANMGYPVVGDKLYLKSKFITNIKSRSLRERVKNFPRHALHASELVIMHPVTGKKMLFRADLPSDMQGLLDFLRVG